MEKRYAPPEYVDHINRIGGYNRYNEPNFKIVWGQNETDLVYGVDANGKRGQHVILKHDGIAAWFINVWKPPEIISPALWYNLTWDWDADAPGIGMYPERGMYIPAPFNLFVRRVENNVMHIDAMPLTHWIIDLVVPNLLKEKESTYEQRKRAIEARIEAERQAAAKKAFDAYLGATPAFGGKAGTYESNREAWEQRIREKQAGMTVTRDEVIRVMGLGHRQIRR